jgi:peptide subunit release factor RF-3
MTKFEKYLEETANTKKYKGVYNWYKENITVYTHATSKEKAHMNMCIQLSKKLNRNVGSIVAYFKTNKYEIDEVQG